MTAPSTVPLTGWHRGASHAGHLGRRYPVSDGAPVEVVESGPSIPARLASLSLRLTFRPALSVLSHVPHLPGRSVFWTSSRRGPGTRNRSGDGRPAQRVGTVGPCPGVLPADGNRRVVLYLHGGAFLTCGVNSHSRIAITLSKFADAPVLVVDYRLIPKHSIGMALDDCYDGYRWLRLRGYEPDQIVIAGDSAGGYLALSLTQRLQAEGEYPAALVALSPLLQLDQEQKQNHPNSHSDALFPPRAFDALVALVARAAAKNMVDGEPEEFYEPLDHIEPGLPRTLIHVSGSEVLLHDVDWPHAGLRQRGADRSSSVAGADPRFPAGRPTDSGSQSVLRQIGEYIREATG